MPFTARPRSPRALHDLLPVACCLVLLGCWWLPVRAQPSANPWTAQTSGVTARLRGVSAVSANVVWASGSGGTVLRTSDGGVTWRPLSVRGSEKLDFRDIDAVDAQTAYILSIGPGDASRIYKTTDSGATWTLQLSNTDPKVFLDAMTFRDARHGFAFSDSVDGHFVVFATANGTTWERVRAEALPPALPNEGAYAASGTNVAVQGTSHAWIGTTASRVLRSTDGGRTWLVSQTPLATGTSSGIFSVAFRDLLHGIAVGGDYRKESEAVDNVAVTSDGGTTWTLVTDKALSGFRSVVAPVPGTTTSWIAVGPSGTDWSDDDGRTWTAVPGGGFDTFSFAPGTQTGWGAGQGGRLARFTRTR